VTEREVQRKLAAIFAADMVGYSRLMASDETGTLAGLQKHRREIIDPKISQYGGRIVKLIGDGMLAEFSSVVDAVQCAIDIQEEIARRHVEQPDVQRLEFRIGVNLGDVIAAEDDIYGDGVNVAARLEGLAEPGGICISRAARDQIRDKMDVSLIDLGEVEVKNIPRPVRAFRVDIGRDRAATDSGPEIEVPEAPARAKPSIAILPLDNMSGDAEQDYFADGITEDIITELSRFPHLFVIARNTTFAYKGKAVNVQDLGRELGVNYVVEGSVRKAGNRVRITVQLIDAGSGDHVWAERYDRELVDIFDLQDEVTQAIVAVLPGRLEAAHAERIKRQRPDNMGAYDYLVRGKIHHHMETEQDNAEALRLLNQAIELDPDYAAAYAWKTCTLGQAIGKGFCDDANEAFSESEKAVTKAISLDENDVECHRILCEIHMVRRQWEDARRHHERAFALNPNDPRIVAQRGELLTWMGEAEEGARWAETAMRLDPFGAGGRAHLLGRALYCLERYSEAIEAYKQIAAPKPGHLLDLAACYAQLGRDGEASDHLAKALAVDPDLTLGAYIDSQPYKEDSDREHHRDGLSKAGLPE
jgi:adenylate cyclase